VYDFLMGLLKSTVEYQNWGWNIFTISAFGTLLFTILQGWGLWKQNRAIWHARSGESISVYFFIYWGWYFSSFLVYGLAKHSITMVANSLQGVVVIPILVGLRKFNGGFTEKEKNFFEVCIPMPLLMALASTYHVALMEVLFFVYLMGLLVIGMVQLFKLVDERKSGVVEPRLIVAFMMAAVFWEVVGIKMNDLPLTIFNPMSFMLFGIILGLWWKYKKAERARVGKIYVRCAFDL